jgi:peptide/nickel transport system permease protein
MTTATETLRADGERRRHVDPTLAVLVGLLALLVLAAVFAPLLAPYQPDQTNILDANAAPSAAHWLGTDELGRDIFSRLLYGARLSLLGPALIVVFSTILGVILAVSSAWVGGWYRLVVSRVVDVLFAFPAVLIAILAVAFFGTGLIAPVIALSVAFTPYAARVVQSVAVRERSLAYIESCGLVGFSGWSICTRHLLPNVMPIIRSQATISFGYAVVAMASVSFLGLGVQPPTPEWGLMVSEGEPGLLNGYPQVALSAGLMIVVVVVLTNLLGEHLERGSDRLV